MACCFIYSHVQEERICHMIARSRLLGEVFAHIDAGTTDLSSAVGISPGQVYFSGAHPSLESEHLFRRRGFLVGLSGLLPAAG
jgi:hypothetical protein